MQAKHTCHHNSFIYHVLMLEKRVVCLANLSLVIIPWHKEEQEGREEGRGKREERTDRIELTIYPSIPHPSFFFPLTIKQILFFWVSNSFLHSKISISSWGLWHYKHFCHNYCPSSALQAGSILFFLWFFITFLRSQILKKEKTQANF